MSRPASTHPRVLVSLTLASLGVAWWGCGATPTGQPTTVTSSSSSGSSGGSGGTGGKIDMGLDGGGGGSVDDGGTCTSTSATAHRVPLDIIFLLDRSGTMHGPKWVGTRAALTTFFNDPVSANIGAGLVFFPSNGPPMPACDPVVYENLVVPIGQLPGYAFNLTNALPADSILGGGTPMYGALKGSLMAATAYQDAHPMNKVILVLATDGESANGCPDNSFDDIALLAKSARDYNGVLTYVIGCSGASITSLDNVAAAGGTTAAYDITSDISLFSAKMVEIRSVALGCDFSIPPPPNGEQLDPDKVNFSYTPKGQGAPTILLRAQNLADCAGQPGWYYDNNSTPTKIVLCPASCTTVQADGNAEVSALFGCKSQIK